MNVTKNGIILTIPDDEVVRMAIDRLNGDSVLLEPGIAMDLGPTPPRIGKVWESQGGIYAGIARGRDGAADYHLIVGPEFDGQIDWAKGNAWAAGLRLHGFSDYTLPFRKEQALGFANVAELFKQEAYWSCEQHASNSDYAWGQDFDYGSQDDWYKDYYLRARAVRRLIIQ